eukprot:CAMPEP_0168612692 /NCGR_PEP_ID=MMETSP0449_2-20121227/3052_1 /TAXON_ID=1082188 /ORGANISM="Strombidium rassoulzadegani, Strain ras09" /LENGTH=71 /DNA_ID=CAMNT_0008653273 /DNA_START=204 /DNA_END=419 /DNA_ORIENTATION=-
MPNGVVPAIDYGDGKLHGETLALLRALGTKHGYYPKDPMEQLKCDEIVQLHSSLFPKIYAHMFIKDKDEQK